MMNQIYFEAKGEALFKTKNLETIYKASEVIGVPFT